MKPHHQALLRVGSQDVEGPREPIILAQDGPLGPYGIHELYSTAFPAGNSMASFPYCIRHISFCGPRNSPFVRAANSAGRGAIAVSIELWY